LIAAESGIQAMTEIANILPNIRNPCDDGWLYHDRANQCLLGRTDACHWKTWYVSQNSTEPGLGDTQCN
jgi:hypothetical protein